MKIIQSWDKERQEWGILAADTPQGPMPVVGHTCVDHFFELVMKDKGVNTVQDCLDLLAQHYDRKFRVLQYTASVVVAESNGT